MFFQRGAHLYRDEQTHAHPPCYSAWLKGAKQTYSNTIARNVLEEYLSVVPPQTVFLFPSEKTKSALSERMLGSIVKKYANRAKLADVSPHDVRHRFGYHMAESVSLHRLA